ncbi:MAG: DUF4447 family protein [Alphaproteobacteria bacterium]|nr:DUF4447 family protein [Alphaproteobacteria bacterium]
MSKKGYLTAAEYKILRQLLGFTQAQAAEFHCVQNIRTIQRWEKGDSWVSELACDKITALAEKINWAIDQALKQAQQFKPNELEITLIIYPDSCYKKFAHGFENLPNSVHQAMIARTYTALKELRYNAGIVEFNPQDYFAYMGATGQTDNQSTRAAWACDYHDRLILN